LFVPVISIDLLGNLSCVVTQRVTYLLLRLSITYWVILIYCVLIRVDWKPRWRVSNGKRTTNRPSEHLPSQVSY